jgi:hypothetical protein
MKKAIHEPIKPVSLIAPASRATDGTTHNGQASGNVGYDLSAVKCREVGVLVHTGALNDAGSLAFTLKHGDVVGTGDASYATIKNGAGTDAAFTIAGTDDNKVFLARLRKDALKKYLDVVVVQAGSNVAMIYGVTLLFGDALTEAFAQAAGVVVFAHNP